MSKLHLKQRIILDIEESTYYSLWYEPQDKKQNLSPRFSPPPAVGQQPDVIPFTGVIRAKPVYFQRVDKDWKFAPSVAETGEKVLKPTESSTLGVNSYLFAGQIVANDRCFYMTKNASGNRVPRDRWTMNFIVDCGVPLLFHMDYDPEPNADFGCLDNYIRDGEYLEGIVKLETSLWPTSGLYQAISGTVESMQILELDSNNSSFGQIVEADFGTKINYDPDALVQTDSIFMTLAVDDIGPLAYKPFPARAKECPEPNYPDMVRLSDEPSIKIVELGKEKGTDSGK